MMDKGKRYLVDTRIYAWLEDQPLMIDAKYLYRFLVANHYMTVAGLYELRRAQMIGSTGIGKDRLEQVLLQLVGTDLIRYDSNLMWVPRIPDEQNIEQKTGWRRQLIRLRSTYADHPSDLPGARNQAYVAFLHHHSARFQYIELYGDADDWNHGRPRQTQGTAVPGHRTPQVEQPSHLTTTESTETPDDVFDQGLQRGNEEATGQPTSDTKGPAHEAAPKPREAGRKHVPPRDKSPPA